MRHRPSNVSARPQLYAGTERSPVVTIEQAAERLELSYSQAWRLVRAGVIASVALGKRISLVRQDSLEAYAAKLAAWRS